MSTVRRQINSFNGELGREIQYYIHITVLILLARFKMSHRFVICWYFQIFELVTVDGQYQLTNKRCIFFF